MLLKDDALYRAILDRRSTRQYQQESLSPEKLAQVDSILSEVEPLQAGKKICTLRLDDIDRADRIVTQGAYGRFIVSPHILLPYLEGDESALTEAGYQSEQIAVRLWQAGIGSCFVGAAGREERLLSHFNLAAGAKTAAALMFGLPTENPRRALATYFRSPDRKRRRLDPESLFIDAARPPEELSPIIEASRWAPSATNAQPWRFAWREGRLWVYLTHTVYPAVLSENSQKTYMRHDGGLVMANISMATRAYGGKATWELADGEHPGSPIKHLPGLLLLASATIG